MPPPPVRPHIPQPRDVLPQFPPEVVFDLHARELGRDVEHGLGVEGAQARGGVDVEAGEQAPGHLGPDAVEMLEGFLGVWSVLEGLEEGEEEEGVGEVRGLGVVRGS